MEYIKQEVSGMNKKTKQEAEYWVAGYQSQFRSNKSPVKTWRKFPVINHATGMGVERTYNTRACIWW